MPELDAAVGAEGAVVPPSTAAAPASPGRRPKVALVIGSGALKCVSAFGVIKVLQREDIAVDMLVGCSGGAFAATWLARGGTDASAGVAMFKAGWAGTFERMAYRKLPGALFPKWFKFDRKFGLMNDGGVNRSVRAFAGDASFSDLNIPMFLVATDFLSGEKVVLDSGRLDDAIRATISIPMVLPPWEVNGRLLMDGAVCDPLPVDVAVREGADIIIAIGFESPLADTVGSGLAMFMQVTSVATNHLYRSQYAFYSMAHHAEVIPVIPEFGCEVGLRDLHLVEHLVACAERETEREVPYLRRLLQAPVEADA